MLIEHDGAPPRVHPSAYVAPNAVLCVRHGRRPALPHPVRRRADGPVLLGEGCIVMENAVARGRAGHPARLSASGS
jgi:carbonic anhydrase/acetyltransferase-like protein (isoleucine patch superfamily)